MTTSTFNLLDDVGLELPCPLCGNSYRLPLKAVDVSQRMMHDGCPLSDERECAPVFYGPLVDPEILHALEAAWKRLEKQAQGAGGHVVAMP